MILALIVIFAWICLSCYLVVIIARTIHRAVYAYRCNHLPRITEWQARQNCAPLSNAFSRHTEQNVSPGPVPVARDHRSPQ